MKTHTTLFIFYLSISLNLQTSDDPSFKKIDQEYHRRMQITTINGEFISQAQAFTRRNFADAISDAQKETLNLTKNMSETEREFQKYKIEMSRNSFLIKIVRNCKSRKDTDPLFASTYDSTSPLPNQLNQRIFCDIRAVALQDKHETAKTIQAIWDSGPQTKDYLQEIKECYKANLPSV